MAHCMAAYPGFSNKMAVYHTTIVVVKIIIY